MVLTEVLDMLPYITSTQIGRRGRTYYTDTTPFMSGLKVNMASDGFCRLTRGDEAVSSAL